MANLGSASNVPVYLGVWEQERDLVRIEDFKQAWDSELDKGRPSVISRDGMVDQHHAFEICAHTMFGKRWCAYSLALTRWDAPMRKVSLIATWCQARGGGPTASSVITISHPSNPPIELQIL